MLENNAAAKLFKPVSKQTLKVFDEVLSIVEGEVLLKCVSTDRPMRSMGPEAETMVKNGLGFVSKMLRSMMVYAAVNIVEDQMQWSASHLPVQGVSMGMVLNNFERYCTALKNALPPTAFKEVLPYLTAMIERQRVIVKEAHGTDA